MAKAPRTNLSPRVRNREKREEGSSGSTWFVSVVFGLIQVHPRDNDFLAAYGPALLQLAREVWWGRTLLFCMRQLVVRPLTWTCARVCFRQGAPSHVSHAVFQWPDH